MSRILRVKYCQSDWLSIGSPLVPSVFQSLISMSNYLFPVSNRSLFMFLISFIVCWFRWMCVFVYLGYKLASQIDYALDSLYSSHLFILLYVMSLKAVLPISYCSITCISSGFVLFLDTISLSHYCKMVGFFVFVFT